MTGVIYETCGGGGGVRAPADDGGGGEMLMVPNISPSKKSKEFDPTAAAVSPPRCSMPSAIPSSYTMTSYHKPAVVRQRPRMWTGGGCSGGLGAARNSFAAVSSAQLSGSKRSRGGAVRHYESDDEDDSSSSSSDEEEEDLITFSAPPPRKICRRKGTRTRPSQFSPHSRRWAPVSSSGISRPSCNFRKSIVTFSRPLVTSVRFRPRTSPDDKAGLFYCRDDQNRFRAEYRTEKRLRMLGDWESEDEDEANEKINVQGNGGDMIKEGEISPAAQENGPNEVDALPITDEQHHEGIEDGKDKDKDNGVHEVTESSSSNEDDSDGEEEHR